MNKKQLDSLSSTLSKAINPAARKLEATARILEHIEPLPVVSKPIHEVSASPATPGKEPLGNPISRTEYIDIPVENTLAKMTTVAKPEPSPWPMATVVKTATVDNMATHTNMTTVDSLATLDKVAEVKGELRVPNTIIDSLLPTLEPAAALLYLRLYRLSHGYRKETCIVGLQKLASATNTSPRTVQRAIDYLERRQLILREGASFGGKTKGIQFRVRVPGCPDANLASVDKTATQAKMATEADLTTVAKMTTLANLATNKDDDLLKTNHLQRGEQASFRQPPFPEPQPPRDARRENATSLDPNKIFRVVAGDRVESMHINHLVQTITVYTTTTKNPWLQTDTVSYFQHSVDRIPIEKVKNVIQAVHERADARINSFAYFVKEILAVDDCQTKGGRRKALAAIVKRVQEIHCGQAGYTAADLVYDIKATCAREGVIFDADLFNEIAKAQ